MEHAEGVITMEDAMRHIDGSDAKACDRDVGGCGVMNSIKHALGGAGGGDAAPRMFCLGLAWDSASVEKEQIVATLRHVSTTLDLGQVYERVPKTTPAYALRCVMCYYGGALRRVRAGGRRRRRRRERRREVAVLRRRDDEGGWRMGRRCSRVREGEAAAVRFVLPARGRGGRGGEVSGEFNSPVLHSQKIRR